MAALYTASISNEMSDITGAGRISKVRKGEGEYAGKVVNVSVAVSRRYPEMKDGANVKGADGKDVWKDVTSFYDMALWGKACEYFKGAVGDIVTFGFSLADLAARPYTKEDGTQGANLKVARAAYIKVIARKQGDGQPQTEASNTMQEPMAEAEIPL